MNTKQHYLDYEIREREIILNSIIDNVGGNIWSIDRDFKILIVNDAFKNTIKQLHGKEMVAGDQIFKLWGIKDEKMISQWKRLYNLAFEGSPQKLIHKFQDGGRTILLELFINPIYLNGEITSLACYSRDVTQKKLQEQQLKAIEARFRALIENSYDGILLLNSDGIISYVSPAVIRILGFSAEELFGTQPLNIAHPDDWERVTEVLNGLLPLFSETREVTFRFRTKAGEWRWMHACMTNMLHDPNIEAIVFNYNDATERIISENEIKNSEILYRYLFNNSPVSMWVCDREKMKFLEVNDSAVEIYGYSREDFQTMTPLDLRRASDKKELFDILAAGNCGNAKNGLRIHVKKSGELMSVDVRVHSIIYKGIEAYLVIAQDVSETLKLEHLLMEERIDRQIQITKATIDGQEKQKAEMGKELHNNINQMLATVKLYLDTYRSHRNEQLLQRSQQILNDSIKEIRNISQSLVPPSLGEMTLEDSLNELVIAGRIAHKNIQLVLYTIDEGSLSDELKISIYRIVQEQLNNIIKHSHAKNVVITLKQSDSKIDLTIEDDGIGFDTGKKRTGIGLKNIINRANVFNGYVEIASSEGQGCKIVVNFLI